MNPSAKQNRREFLQSSIAGGVFVACSSATTALAQVGSEQRIVVGVMGLSRGLQLASALASLPNCVVKYVCDVDEKVLAAGVKATAAKQSANKTTEAAGGPEGVRDFRRMLDDKGVDAIAIATPDHWHSPAAILALSAGKHAYVEKPCSHNPREGELLVEAAKKSGKCVQHGTQRRTWPKVVEAIQKVKDGAIGKVLMSRGWYNNTRKDIGHGKPAPVPANLDWDLWQGPAPAKEFHDNYVHYNWHWFWHWGTGEAGNNGVHAIDVCRWGLGVDYPKRVVCGGGRYHFDDDQETPDTQFITYDFGDKVIHFEGRSCHPRGPENNGSGFGIAFYGEGGSVVTDGVGYAIYDLKNKEIAKVAGTAGDPIHCQNFLDAVRANDPSKLNAPIAEGAMSALYCHLGNIAWRTGRTVNLDAKTGRITGDEEQAKLWSREYRQGWEPRV
jgi:predicted dehydrogenase